MLDIAPIEELVAAIDVDYFDEFPEEALRAAQRRRDEIIPHLIGLIRRATETARRGEVDESSGCIAALFLLTEFSAKEALPAIIESLSLPGEGSFDLYGDIITECISGVFAELAADTPDVVDRLIADRSLNEYVRWEAAQTYLHYVRDGRMTREAAVDRLRAHLANALAGNDTDVIAPLICELANLVPQEAMGEIREAFERRLVDDSIITLEYMELEITKGESGHQTRLNRCEPTGCADTVEELRSWFAGSEVPDKDLSDVAVDGEWGDPHDRSDDGNDWNSAADVDPPITIHRAAAKVGRNEPCPCGSGKKYKKCCGRES